VRPPSVERAMPPSQPTYNHLESPGELTKLLTSGKSATFCHGSTKTTVVAVGSGVTDTEGSGVSVRWGATGVGVMSSCTVVGVEVAGSTTGDGDKEAVLSAGIEGIVDVGSSGGIVGVGFMPVSHDTNAKTPTRRNISFTMAVIRWIIRKDLVELSAPEPRPALAGPSAAPPACPLPRPPPAPRWRTVACWDRGPPSR
jgi:hypothetical protein